ncbi:MAG: NTP transferase domain-containing protein [Muribaculaceae bacterium]|nr:NTP transferase domain-containing protein [Muribaculaceae bacterium]
MKAFILAAGLGSRLKPWTDSHPKALVPIGGTPVLQLVVEKLRRAGISDITVNVYHFADQIIDFVKDRNWNINIVDERPTLLETGGAILNAAPFLDGDEDILVHNADILSNVDIPALSLAHKLRKADATLLVSDRRSSRKLVFGSDGRLEGWHSLSDDSFRPSDFKASPGSTELAFSGIYVISPAVIASMKSRGFSGKFSIMDFFLGSLSGLKLYGHNQEDLQLLDIGKPDSLNRADEFLSNLPQ